LVLSSLENILLPFLSNKYYKENILGLKSAVIRIYTTWLPLYFLVMFVVILTAINFYRVLYGDKFQNVNELIYLFSVQQFSMGLSFPLILGLRVIEYTRAFFYIHVMSSLFVLSIGVYLVTEYASQG